MIRELGESVGNAVLRRSGRASARVQERRPLPVDLLESDDAYLAVFDGPGASAGDVQVRYADRRLLVRVDRFRSFHEGFDMRFPGRGLSMDGEVELPADAAVDPDAAEATLTERGTLEVRVPKLEEGSASSSVPVREAGEGADDETAPDEGEGEADDEAT